MVKGDGSGEKFLVPKLQLGNALVCEAPLRPPQHNDGATDKWYSELSLQPQLWFESLARPGPPGEIIGCASIINAIAPHGVHDHTVTNLAVTETLGKCIGRERSKFFRYQIVERPRVATMAIVEPLRRTYDAAKLDVALGGLHIGKRASVPGEYFVSQERVWMEEPRGLRSRGFLCNGVSRLRLKDTSVNPGEITIMPLICADLVLMKPS